MSFLERAREKALAAGEHLRSAAAQQSGTGNETEQREQDVATSTAVGDAVQRGLESARHGLASLVERLDPRLLADVVMKATSVQERTNAALREKGSPYRIDGISITATIPPQISFSINRSGEAA